MRFRHLALVAVLGVLPFAAVVPGSVAAVPQCDGQDATILGTAEADELTGTPGPDVVVLGSGDDRFVGGDGDDVVCGDGGADTIYPGAGNDSVFGGDGEDTVYAGTGDDEFDGGLEFDRLVFAHLPNALDLVVDARLGTATSTQGSVGFTSVAGFVGTSHQDRLIGTGADEFLDGFGGWGDQIHGFDGWDRIVLGGPGAHVWAGRGNDTVYTTTGKSSISLGIGHDTVVYRGNAAGSWWDGGDGSDTVKLGGETGFTINLKDGYVESNTGTERWTIIGFVHASGSRGPDRIVGNSLANGLSGGYGNDLMIGLGGADDLYGAAGANDRSDGGSGFDFCSSERAVGCEVHHTGPALGD